MIGTRRVLTLVAFASSLAGCGGSSRSASLPQAAQSLASGQQVGRQANAATTGSGTRAATAQAFVDSVGVNVHLSDYGSPYDPKTFSKLQSLVNGSGILHLRDGMPYGQRAPASEAQQLAANGVRFDYIVGKGDTASQIDGWFSSIGPNVADACEGINEPDGAGGSWPASATAEQQTIYGVCHPRGLPVFAPAMLATQDYASLGNVGAYADDANMHDYFSWRNPGTPGWGDGGYGSLGYNEQMASAEAPSAPFVATETGYSSSTNDSSYLPEAVRARYLARTTLEAFRSGVTRTYLYEFADEGGSPASANGLVDGSLTTKASYGAIGGLLGMLADPGASFAPGSLGFTVSGGDANIYTLLLQKRDGTFWLALWDETQEYQGDQRAYQTAAAESLTLTFAQMPSAITTHVLQDGGTYTSTSVPPSASIALAVDGHPTLVQLTIAAATPTAHGIVSMTQHGGANNGSQGTYALSLPSSITVGNAVFGGLAAAPKASGENLSYFSVVDALTNDGQIAYTLDEHTVVNGDGGANFTANVNGGDWASGVAFEVTGEDGSAPLASDTSADSTNANVTCPAAASGATIRAGSLVACIVYVNGGTQNGSLAQSPGVGAGWVFDGASGAQYNEVFLFHRKAPTAAGEIVPSTTVNLSTNGGMQYLTGTHEQTLVIQPPGN